MNRQRIGLGMLCLTLLTIILVPCYVASGWGAVGAACAGIALSVFAMAGVWLTYGTR